MERGHLKSVLFGENLRNAERLVMYVARREPGFARDASAWKGTLMLVACEPRLSPHAALDPKS